MTRFLCLALLCVAACEGPAEIGPDAGSEVSEVGQGSPARGALVVNEVLARPESGPDSIELFNRSDAAIDLCDYFVSDSLDRLDHYYHLGDAPPPQECQPKTLAAGDYLVVFADDDAAAGSLHAPFKLGDADQVHIVSTRGETIDSLIYLLPAGSKGESLARQPSGEGLFWISAPSLGSANPEELRP